MSKELKLVYEALGNGFAKYGQKCQNLGRGFSQNYCKLFPFYKEKSILKYWLKKKNR